MSKKALILTWESYQDHEVVYPFYRVQEEGFEVDIMANKLGRIFGILGTYNECTQSVFDLDDKKVKLNLKGAKFGDQHSRASQSQIEGAFMFPMVQKQNSGNSGRSQANFGDNPTFGGRVGLTDSTFKDASGYGTFRYEPPEGYNALCTANLPDPPLKDPSKYFTATKYRGNGNVGRKVTTGLEPALVIIKPTNFSDNWIVNGSPFGVEYYLSLIHI